MTETVDLADLLARLGGVPADRVRLFPAPGEATEDDLEAATGGDRSGLCELIDGTLVEKAMGWEESGLAMRLAMRLGAYLEGRNLGLVSGEQGGYRLRAGVVLFPDVSFTTWERVREGRAARRRRSAYPPIAPDLAVEILSEDNTAAEMERKAAEYFAAGVRLLWVADPVARTVAILTAPGQARTLTDADTLDGGEVLPGFALPLAAWFDSLDEPSATGHDHPAGGDA